jgi:flagellar biosynthesis/type III secretory pathway protein FliH
MEITWEEALTTREKIGLSRGLAEGEAKGKAKGKAEGMAEATREAIIMAMSRLGSVPTEVTTRLDAITDLEKLQSIFIRSGHGSGDREPGLTL